MTETQHSPVEQSFQLAPSQPRRWRAILGGLLLAVSSPLAVLAPKRFARWFAGRPVAVVVWLLLMWGGYELYAALPMPEYMPYTAIAADVLLGLLGLAILWLLAAYVVRPVGSTWDETVRRSYWKGGAVLLAFVLPLVLVMHGVDRLLWWWMFEPQTSDSGSANWYPYSVISAAAIQTVFWLGIVQTVRGLASLNHAGVPSLAPICRDCGYSLEGVTDLYEGGRPRDEADPAIPRVCPECGCEITVSLDATKRPGTAWTRGQSRSPGAWLGTAGQVVWRPGQFFSRLPLHSSRKAALWFWLGSIAMTFVLVGVVFAVEHALCANVGEMGSLLQPRSVAYWQTRDTDPQSMVSPTLLWLGDGGNQVGGVTLIIVGLATLVVTRSANQIGRLMSRDRGTNLHPAGLLVAAYLSPAVLAAGVVVFAVAAWSRPLLAGWLTRAPALARKFINEPDMLAIAVLLVGIGLALAWCYRVARQASRGIRYANQ